MIAITNILAHKFRPFFFCTIFAFLLTIPAELTAQISDVTFQQIFLQHGLSQSIVKCILQDRKGFMYFGTEDGLNRYDGYKFLVYRYDPEDTNSISYNDINCLYEDNNRIIWIGTFNAGLNRFDQSKKNINRFQHDGNNPNSLSHNNIICICEDKSGNLWIGTDNGLNRLNLNNTGNKSFEFKKYFYEPENSKSINSNSINSLFTDRDGNLWIGTSNGVCKLTRNNIDKKKFEFERILFEEHNIANSITVRAFCQDKDGNFWIGSDHGLYKLTGKNNNSPLISYFPLVNDRRISPRNNDIYALCFDNSGYLWIGTNGGGIILYDIARNKFTVYTNDPQDSRSLSYNEIRAIYKDRSGIMWVGTYGAGINKVTRGAREFFHYTHIPNETNSLSHPIIWSIYEDSDSVLWIGTHGGGLDRFDRKSSTYSHFVSNRNNPASISSNIVRVVIQDKEGYLWLGTNGGGINRFNKNTGQCEIYENNPRDKNSLASNNIRCIYEDKLGDIWVGTYGNGMDKFNKSEKNFIHYVNNPDDSHSLSNNFVRTIYEDKQGSFWIGTEGGGLNKFDRKNNIFKYYRHNPNNSNSINNDYVFSILEDKDRIFWIGTYGGGLVRFDPLAEKFTSFTTKDGLIGDAIYGVLQDKNGNLWISSSKGLSKFNPLDKKVTNYTVSDGLQSNEFNGGSYFKSKSGEMFFGGINGFNAFYPEKISGNNYIPSIAITSFQKFNQEVSTARPISELNEIKLSYEDYFFSFEFSSLDFSAPEKNKYAYKMEGLDDNWIFTTSDKRYASYTTLPPGNYVFRVIGSNSDGIWNNTGTSINLIITPPFWNTWWFMALSFITFLAIGFITYKSRLKNIRIKAELKTAHDAQISIMPECDPKIEGLDISGVCIPANEVGGDFFDYFWLDKSHSHFGIMVGDVSGKAMKAAMTAVMASGMIIAEADESKSVSDMLTLVNKPIYNKTARQMFTAVILLSIDVNSGEILFTNAGMPNPVLKSNGTIDIIKSDGPRFPLGMMKDAAYTENRLNPKKDDVLVLITDGITEALSRKKEFFGENRLEDLLKGLDTSKMTSSEIKKCIINEIMKFSDKNHLYDDLTIVVIKF
jgi:ligand-binding sensor domain-containing protein